MKGNSPFPGLEVDREGASAAEKTSNRRNNPLRTASKTAKEDPGWANRGFHVENGDSMLKEAPNTTGPGDSMLIYKVPRRTDWAAK